VTELFAASAPAAAPARAQPSPRHFLMCPPLYFDVAYAINPWMDPSTPVDPARALEQWEALRAAYVRLGHRVDLLDPVPGLPDMVFAANGATVVDGLAYGARFATAERADEAAAHRTWFADAGLGEVVVPTFTNEGEGDFTPAGRWVLAGSGFRTDPRAHREAQELFGVPVVSLTLADARYYHLDTALFVLDEHNVCYYPDAFTAGSRRVLERLYPDAVRADAGDAAALGLNAVSDGRHVVLPSDAPGLAERLAARGYEPVPVDVSELRRAGGGPKCCTLEVRA
jgi:N-dimethylarginine dimethylaminohydrolase